MEIQIYKPLSSARISRSLEGERYWFVSLYDGDSDVKFLLTVNEALKFAGQLAQVAQSILANEEADLDFTKEL